MPTPIKEFTKWMFYEEMLDKDIGISHGMVLAVKAGTRIQPEHGNDPYVFGVVKKDNRYETQPVSIQYIFDYCIKVPQIYAADYDPKIIKKLKDMGEETRPAHNHQRRPVTD